VLAAFMEAIPLCLPVSKSHQCSPSQHSFSLFQILPLLVCYMFRPVSFLRFYDFSNEIPDNCLIQAETGSILVEEKIGNKTNLRCDRLKKCRCSVMNTVEWLP